MFGNAPSTLKARCFLAMTSHSGYPGTIGLDVKDCRTLALLGRYDLHPGWVMQTWGLQHQCSPNRGRAFPWKPPALRKWNFLAGKNLTCAFYFEVRSWALSRSVWALGRGGSCSWEMPMLRWLGQQSSEGLQESSKLQTHSFWNPPQWGLEEREGKIIPRLLTATFAFFIRTLPCRRKNGRQS